jgi:hypothetical protein
MVLVTKLISWISLIVLIAPSILFLGGKMELDQVKLIMLMATIVWFVSTPIWMWKEKTQ